MRRLLFGLFLIVTTHPAAAQGHWYYCDPAHAYYPYVSTCPVPWREVAPYSSGQEQPHAAGPPTSNPLHPLRLLRSLPSLLQRNPGHRRPISRGRLTGNLGYLVRHPDG